MSLTARRTQEFWLPDHVHFRPGIDQNKHADRLSGSVWIKNTSASTVVRSPFVPFKTQTLHLSTAAVPPRRKQRALSSRVFKRLRSGTVSRARLWMGQLRAPCKMLLTGTLVSLCNHDNRGSAHPKFLYRSGNHVGISTNWMQRFIKTTTSEKHDSVDGTRFYYGNTPAPHRLHNYYYYQFFSPEARLISLLPETSFDHHRCRRRRFSLDTVESPQRSGHILKTKLMLSYKTWSTLIW